MAREPFKLFINCMEPHLRQVLNTMPTVKKTTCDVCQIDVVIVCCFVIVNAATVVVRLLS